MTQPQLFGEFVVTAVLCISGGRELVNKNWPLGLFMFAIPAGFWLSVLIAGR